jgi:Gpi18-like mannosyltransferase
MGLAFLLTRFFKDQKTKERVFKIWMLSPVALYTSFMFGQFDIIPTFFVILSTLLLYKKKFILSALFLGVSTTFKFFPLYFLPFFIVLTEGNYLKKLLMFVLGLLPLALSIFPFINLPAFQKNVLFGAHTANIGHASLYIGAGQTISVFLIIYLVVFLAFSSREKNIDNLWKYLLAVLLVFYSLSAFHPQWFLWAVPFLTIWWIKNPEDHVFQASLYSLYVLKVLLFEPTVNIGLFGPLSTIFAQIPSLENTIARFLEPNLIRGYVHSVFAGLSLFIVTRSLVYGK